jgi:hypothetical protein
MILGMSTSTFTLVHVILSLIGIFAGLVVFFPGDRLLPSHIVGIISLVVLAVAIFALYVRHLAGAWRWIYVVSAVLALYLNVFVGVVQAFQKLAFLKALAPNQSEPPFVIAQAVVLVLFVALGIAAMRAFHPRTKAPGLSPA